MRALGSGLFRRPGSRRAASAEACAHPPFSDSAGAFFPRIVAQGSLGQDIAPVCPRCVLTALGSRPHWLPPASRTTVSVRDWAVPSGPSFTGEALAGGGHGGFPGDALLNPAPPVSPRLPSGSAVAAEQPGTHTRAHAASLQQETQEDTDGHTGCERPGPALGVEEGPRWGAQEAERTEPRGLGAAPQMAHVPPRSTRRARVDASENQCSSLGHAVGPRLHLLPWQEDLWGPRGVTSCSQRVKEPISYWTPPRRRDGVVRTMVTPRPLHLERTWQVFL
ncbi:uncharacterized protein LOC123783338 [Ursus americanus]|uniref:uncharacterized protein LOC123783338 n=1 Tax=Ursus americanus TaxID=9643 RepID=UPI001E67DBD0|nr:uncharacterized protein LOC123783338 [Ursus americanus]